MRITVEIDRPLTIDQYACAMGKSRQTVYRWISDIKKGLLRPLTYADLIELPGSCTLIRPDALDRWLKLQEEVKRQKELKAVNETDKINQIAKDDVLNRLNKKRGNVETESVA